MIKAEFTPPRDLSVLEAGILLRGSLDKVVLTATVLDLAERGHYKVEFEPNSSGIDFRLHRPGVSPSDDALSREEKIIKAFLFKSGNTDSLLISSVVSRIDEHRFFYNLDQLTELAILSFVAKGIFNRPSSVKLMLYTFSYWLMQFMTFALLSVGMVSLVAIVFAFFDPAILFPSYVIILTFMGSFVFGILCYVVSAKLIAQRAHVFYKLTEKGEEKKRELLGFKHYIEVAEKDRIQFHESIDAEKRMFTMLLPYAILFGAEKTWIGLLHK